MTNLHLRQRFLTVAALVLTLGLFGAAVAPGAVAQQIEELSGAPVNIHSGTCEEPVLEPAYDGGTLGVDTLAGIEDDELSQVGLLNDDAAGAFGIDLNDDDVLDENEILGGIDQDVPVAWADAEFEAEVDMEQQWAVVVHVDADAGFGTFIACGSLTDSAEDDEGRRIVPLQPQGEYTAFGYAVLAEDGQSLNTYLFQPGTVPASTPDPLASSEGPFPIGVHSGTCTDWTTESAYDIGDMQLTNVAAEGEQEAGDVEGDVPEAAAELGPVYKADADTDFDGQELLDDGPYVIAVHQSAEEYDTLVACGAVLDFVEGDRLIVPLQPVGESNLTGVALLQSEEAEASAFLWQCEPIEPVMKEAPTPAPTPTPTPAPTPTPTPTPEPVTITETEVITVTEVVTETTVVPAAEATQLAQEGTPIELGAESPGALTSQAGQSLMITNTSDVERVFRIEALGIEETIPAGEQLEVVFPDDVQPGDYDYQVLEDGAPVFEDLLTIE